MDYLNLEKDLDDILDAALREKYEKQVSIGEDGIQFLKENG